MIAKKALAFTLIAGLVVVLSGCGGSSPSGPSTWKPVALESLSEIQKSQKAKALVAKEAMFDQLMAKLMKELAGGPDQAIAVCQDEAPKIAAAIGKEHGVKIGRTSVKLRNAKNQPPAWAKATVEKGVAEPTQFAGSNGELGVLLPIKLQQPCLLCHGPVDKLAPEVKDALTKRYPSDQATGFKEGDLRGWFWIEAPAPL